MKDNFWIKYHRTMTILHILKCIVVILIFFFLMFLFTNTKIGCTSVFAANFPIQPDKIPLWQMEISQAATDNIGNTYAIAMSTYKIKVPRIEVRKYSKDKTLLWTRSLRMFGDFNIIMAARVVDDKLYIAGMIYREKPFLIYKDNILQRELQVIAKHYVAIYTVKGVLLKLHISPSELYASNEIVTDMHFSHKGALFICGVRSLPHKDNKYICFIYKYDQGIIQWFERYERAESLYKQCVITTDHRGYIYLGGGSESTFFLVKYSPEGTFIRDQLSTTYLEYYQIADIYADIRKIYLVIEPTVISCIGSDTMNCSPTLIEIYKFDSKKLHQRWWTSYTMEKAKKYIDIISYSQIKVVNNAIYIISLAAEVHFPPINWNYYNFLICFNHCGDLVNDWISDPCDFTMPVSISSYRTETNQTKLILGILKETTSELLIFDLPKIIESPIKFYGGWNLFSMPVNPLKCNGWEKYFPGLEVIYEYNLEGYQKIPRNENLIPGRGYWAYTACNLEYKIRGWEILNIKKDLQLSFDLIGTCTDITDYRLDNGLIKTIFGFDSEIKAYHRMAENESLIPGKGYWIFTEHDSDKIPKLCLFKSPLIKE